MRSSQILLLTGSAGAAQGWGDEEVTAAIAAAARRTGFAVTVVECESPPEVTAALRRVEPQLVWSSLYAFSGRSDINVCTDDSVWVADLVEAEGLPMVGPPPSVLRLLLGKFATHEALCNAGIPVPLHWLCPVGAAVPEVEKFPVIVKPEGESRSVGIYDDSVAFSAAEVDRCCRRIHRNFAQSALIEEFLPGTELTAMVLGDDGQYEVFSGVVQVDVEHYGPHRVLRGDLRGVGLTRITPSGRWEEEAARLATAAISALGCRDHVRIDMREDASGRLRIMEVNGIPGLKPGKSWSPQLYSLYHPEYSPEVSYDRLIAAILESARRRLDARRN